MSKLEPAAELSFENTEFAFESFSDKELRDSYFLFRMMSNTGLVNVGSKLGLFAIKCNLPFAKTLVRKTIFKQFCGGESLLDCQPTIDKLHSFNTLSILDYGAESKTSDEELDEVEAEYLRTIELAASNNSVPVIVIKLTGLAANELLEKMNDNEELNDYWSAAKKKFLTRVDNVCKQCKNLGVGVFIDAEESWMQDAMDAVVNDMMEQYNRDEVIVYNTYQMYRHDRLEKLKADHEKALSSGYMLGAKFVRGAYMNKERERASELGYPSPIHKDKAAVDADYNETIKYCVDNYKTIGSCCATHNMDSSLLQAKLISEKSIAKNHPNLNFCQLYGMSDYITFNLAKAGYNAAKYIVYGSVKEVVPYLIRRAQENSSVTGEMGRELRYLKKEMQRRKLI